MAYEAPRITEAGRFSDVTLGDKFDITNEDNTYFWGIFPAFKGSR